MTSLDRSIKFLIDRGIGMNKPTSSVRQLTKKKEYRESISSEKRKEILAESKPDIIDGIVTLVQNKMSRMAKTNSMSQPKKNLYIDTPIID